MKQNPFSFYDFLGYMIPGAVLLYLFTLIFGTTEIHSLFNIDNSAKNTNQLISFIPAVISAYLLGHVLAIGSSAVIESFSNITNGYPSTFLFNVSQDSYYSTNKFGRFILWIIIFPISFFELIFKKILKIDMFNQAKSLPSPLKEAVFIKCELTLKEHIKVDTSSMNIRNGINGDYLRLLYHFVFETSERHSGKLQNYVALYGLTRNVSFVFILVFWGSAIAMCKASIAFNPALLLALSLLSYSFYIGFVKFYRRFSLETIMATSVYIK
jgi:hypothetical protein